MKNLILTVAIAACAFFATAATAEAACCKKTCCVKKCCKPVTTEICRRYFCKTKCVCGCPKTIRYVEITYRTVKCNGKCKTWKKTYRCN